MFILVEVGRMSSRPEKFGTAVFKRIPIGCCKEGVYWAKPFFRGFVEGFGGCFGIRKATRLSR